jgi:DNA polymerase-1
MSLKQRLGLEREPLYLVDGSSYLYRGFYAFPDLARSDGMPTNALYIVLRIVTRLLREEDPKYMAFFLDKKGKTFRHEVYADYKANRPSAPEDLVRQIEPVRRALATLGIRVHTSEAGEADDCIASLAARHKHERPVVIMGGDKDLLQCLDAGVVVWDPGGKKEKLVTLEDFSRDYGLEPGNWPDFQALTGDSSDNIPGVPGIGPKTAMKILARHPRLEDVREHVHDYGGAVGKKLAAHIEETFTWRELTRLRTDICTGLALDDLRRETPDPASLRGLLEEFEFRSMVEAIPHQVLAPGHDASRPGEQMSLFGSAPQPSDRVVARPCSRVDELPGVDGAEVGLVRVADLPQDGDAATGSSSGALRLGLDREELHYTGPHADLARHLESAARIHTPSLKALYADDPAWERLDYRSWFDLSLGAYLLSPEERNYSWTRIRDASGLDPESPHPDPGEEGLGALAVGQHMALRLEQAGLAHLMFDLEMPLISVLVAMERAGIRIDLAAFQEFLDEVARRLDELHRGIIDLAGHDFNPRSSPQLAHVLFEELGLKPGSKTPGGAASTSQAVLEKLSGQHEIIGLLLEFRMLDKLRSTYLEPLPRMVDADHRLHTTFNQLATATGRLSSSGPNLQNIPIRGPLGLRMRSCFTARPGCLLAAADYSQIELRLLAHLSRDPELMDAFARGQDIHSRTAGLLFDAPPRQVSPEQRRQAKTINFGLLYGMGPQRLARELSVPMKEAKSFIERYFRKLTGIAEFFEAVESEARERGYVTTIAGRRRLLPEIDSANPQMRSAARRQAINARVQGSAADIIKMAMIQAHGDEALRGLGARLILQVHDELLLETPEDAAREAGERLAAIMSGVMDLDVALEVDFGVGTTWAQAH